MAWVTKSLSQKEYNDKRFEVAVSVSPYWGDYTSYERCTIFYKEASTVMITIGEFAGLSVWQAVESMLNERVDLTKVTSTMHSPLFRIANDALRVLRWDCPDLIPIIIGLAMPKADGECGQCSFLPNGLSLLASAPASFLQEFTKDLSPQKPAPAGATPVATKSHKGSGKSTKGGKKKACPKPAVVKQGKRKVPQRSNRIKQAQEKLDATFAEIVAEEVTASTSESDKFHLHMHREKITCLR